MVDIILWCVGMVIGMGLCKLVDDWWDNNHPRGGGTAVVCG